MTFSVDLKGESREHIFACTWWRRWLPARGDHQGESLCFAMKDRQVVDLMKRNKDVGAACGRIHPTGSGYMQWWANWKRYLLNAVSLCHWPGTRSLSMPSDTGFRRQQNTCLVVFSAGRNNSQMFLIVLTLTISPGCFSLFRAKAVMDENVMHTYTTVASQPKHFVQYDQVAIIVVCGWIGSGWGPMALHSSTQARMESWILGCERLLHSLPGGEILSHNQPTTCDRLSASPLSREKKGEQHVVQKSTAVKLHVYQDRTEATSYFVKTDRTENQLQTCCWQGFKEFYNQRRRWMPSTLLNIIDLVSDYKQV